MTQLAIAVITSRETIEVVLNTVHHALRAAEGYSYQLHLLCNGDDKRAEQIAETIKTQYPTAPIEVWYFALADKANCLNMYWHELKPDAEMHFFIDGYVKLNSDSFSNIAKVHSIQPHLAYTGIPANGKSSESLRLQMLKEGGFHGNLIMLPKHSLETLVKHNFRLPICLYRTDSTLGAYLCFNFSPETETWQPKHIKVVADAGWTFQPLRWFKLKDLQVQFLRKRRQALGTIENKAVKQIFAIESQPASKLPDLATDLCCNYLQKFPFTWLDYIKKPLLYLAIKDLEAKKNNNEHTLKLSRIFRKLT